MNATRISDVSKTTVPLHLAFELSCNEWKLAFTTGHGQAPRLRNIGARDLDALTREIAKAKERFGLPADTSVVSCYEAGRDGFWLHRCLIAQGVLYLSFTSLESHFRSQIAELASEGTMLVTPRIWEWRLRYSKLGFYLAPSLHGSLSYPASTPHFSRSYD